PTRRKILLRSEVNRIRDCSTVEKARSAKRECTFAWDCKLLLRTYEKPGNSCFEHTPAAAARRLVRLHTGADCGSGPDRRAESVGVEPAVPRQHRATPGASCPADFDASTDRPGSRKTAGPILRALSDA